MKNFASFIDAENAAADAASCQLIDGAECLAFWVIRERKAGRPFTEKEREIYGELYENARGEFYHKILEGYILEGRVPECRASRRFMAGLPVWP